MDWHWSLAHNTTGRWIGYITRRLNAALRHPHPLNMESIREEEEEEEVEGRLIIVM